MHMLRSIRFQVFYTLEQQLTRILLVMQYHVDSIIVNEFNTIKDCYKIKLCWSILFAIQYTLLFFCAILVVYFVSLEVSQCCCQHYYANYARNINFKQMIFKLSLFPYSFYISHYTFDIWVNINTTVPRSSAIRVLIHELYYHIHL